MLRQVLLLFCFLALGTGLPVVISRYGGRRRRQRAEEQRWINTCSVARVVNPDINLGQCPFVKTDYKHLYTRDSLCFLDDYYKNRCDIVRIKERGYLDDFLCGLTAACFMLMASMTVVSCAFALFIELCRRIARLVA
jgi:hypothetical protein